MNPEEISVKIRYQSLKKSLKLFLKYSRDKVLKCFWKKSILSFKEGDAVKIFEYRKKFPKKKTLAQFINQRLEEFLKEYPERLLKDYLEECLGESPEKFQRKKIHAEFLMEFLESFSKGILKQFKFKIAKEHCEVIDEKISEEISEKL